MKAMRASRVLMVTVALTVLPFGVACGDHGGGQTRRPFAAGTAAAASAGHLVITTDNGLRLRPTDGGRVTVDDHARGLWSHRNGTWTLDLSCPERNRNSGTCARMPYVRIPDGVSVTVSARNAGIDVAGVAAALDLTTVNGDVTVVRSGRADAPVRLSTRNGSVRAAALDAVRLHATTTNGDVVLACATAPSSVTATTTNGSVDVTVPHNAPAYAVKAGTDNGRTTVAVPTQEVHHGQAMTLTTVNGDVGVRLD
jgi:hypothetical protein